jgi:hypothetical protein
MFLTARIWAAFSVLCLQSLHLFHRQPQKGGSLLVGSKACRGKSSLALLAYVYCVVAFSDYERDLGLEFVFESGQCAEFTANSRSIFCVLSVIWFLICEIFYATTSRDL